MSNFGVPIPSGDEDPPIVETNYVVMHNPVSVQLPPPSAPPPSLPAPVPVVTITQPRKPPTQVQLPKYQLGPQQETQHSKLLPALQQQQRPAPQFTYNRPRILSRGPANGGQAQGRQYKAIGIGSPTGGPSSPASPAPVLTPEASDTGEQAGTSIPDASSSMGVGIEGIFMATVGTESGPNESEASFGNQISEDSTAAVLLCQENSDAQPTQGIQLNLLAVGESSQQIQFPMSDIGVYELIGLPIQSSAVDGSNLLGVSGSLQSQITQNSSLTYTLDMNQDQSTISIEENESQVIRGLEEYLLASSSSSSSTTTCPIEMTGQSESTTETAEDMGDEGTSVMTFEDFRDLIRSFPMNPSDEITAGSADQVQTPLFDVSPDASNQASDRSVPFEETETQEIFVLNTSDSDEKIESNLLPLHESQNGILAPEAEENVPVKESVIETIESFQNKASSESSEIPPLIQASTSLAPAEIPIIDISSDEPLVTESFTVGTSAGIFWSFRSIPNSEADEAKLEPLLPVTSEGEPKSADLEALPSTCIIMDKLPQENGIETSVTNGIPECHVKLEADEEFDSTTPTDMSPTDSALDTDSDRVIDKSKDEVTKPLETPEPVVNGVKVEKHDEAVSPTRTYTIDPSVFSNRTVKLVWENGIGTFPGTGLKFRVNPITGVLETCESSLNYVRAINQDENKIPSPPIKKPTPLLNSTKGKKNFIPLAMNKTKNNPIVGMARTQTNKNLPRKVIASAKKKSLTPETDESGASKEEVNSVKVKVEPNDDESDSATSTAGNLHMDVDTVKDLPDKTKNIEPTASTSSKKSPPSSRPVSPAKSKYKTAKKTGKLNSAPIPVKVEDLEPEKIVYAKKSAPIPVLPVLPEQVVEMSSFTVVPILQNSSPVPSPEAPETDDEPAEEEEEEEVAEIERQRRNKVPRVPFVPKGKKLKKRRKKVTVEQKLQAKRAANKELRKRNFEKVLSTRTQHFNNVAQAAADSATNTTVTESSCASDGNEELAPAAAPQSSSSAPDFSGKTRSGSVTVITEFLWNKYLSDMNAKGAPPRLFRQPAFPPPNPFKVGMMLEAIDPQHQSLCCVASIREIQGYRLRIHITGFSESYDFWVNADSYEIFPAGWCEENGHTLEAPPDAETPFNWHKYLIDEQLIAADRNFFAISKEDPVMNSDVVVGMKLEAVDIRNQSLICVATIAQVINDRFLVHFDSWDTVYDYWTDSTSPFIHPVGWCDKNGAHLTPPNTCKNDFSWEKYLQETKSIPMPSHLFRPLPAINFKTGMKLECVDKRNPYLIRVATILDVEGHQLTIHFDHWPSVFDYTVYECSPDIHPPGWSAHSGHPLQPPPPLCTPAKPWNGTCSVYGCLGLGHVKGPKFLTHNTPANCPYSQANFKKELLDFVQDRVITYEKSLSMSEMRRDSTNLSPLKTREKRKLEQNEYKSGKIQQQRKSDLYEVPAKITKRKSTGRKSDPVLPSTSQSPSEAQMPELKEEVPVKAEPMQESGLLIDTLPLIRKTKLTYRQLHYGSTSADTFQKLSPAEKDKLTIESVPMTEDQQDASPESSTSKDALSVLRKNLALKRKSEKPISPKPKRLYTPRGTKAKVTPLLVGPVLPEKLTGTSGLVLPKIESTITACPPPGSGATRTYHTWDETIDSVVRACLRKGSEDGQSEFSLPPSTTMTPINVPTTLPLSIQTQDMAPKSENTLLLMMIPTQAGGPATTNTASSSVAAIPAPAETVTSIEQPAEPRSRAGSACEEMRPRKSSQMSPYQSPLSNHGESDCDLPINYAIHVRPLQAIVGDLSQNVVAKWMTKDVADFVSRIPGCTSAVTRFTEQKIDGDAFLLMNQNEMSRVMGLKMGHCVKLSHAIRLIHNNSNGSPVF